MKWMKWHGAGNDFLIGDWSEAYTESEWQSLIVKISHRHFGVGADGVMLGSAVSKRLQAGEPIEKIEPFVRSLKEATQL